MKLGRKESKGYLAPQGHKAFRAFAETLARKELLARKAPLD